MQVGTKSWLLICRSNVTLYYCNTVRVRTFRKKLTHREKHNQSYSAPKACCVKIVGKVYKLLKCQTFLVKTFLNNKKKSKILSRRSYQKNWVVQK